MKLPDPRLGVGVDVVEDVVLLPLVAAVAAVADAVVDAARRNHSRFFFTEREGSHTWTRVKDRMLPSWEHQQ